MKKQVRGYQVTISNLLSNDIVQGPFELFIPVKATILSLNAGTLAKDETGRLFLIQKGEWFRGGYYGLPQIEEFDELQAVNYTELRKEIVEMKSLSETGEIEVKEVEILEVAKKKKK